MPPHGWYGSCITYNLNYLDLIQDDVYLESVCLLLSGIQFKTPPKHICRGCIQKKTQPKHVQIVGYSIMGLLLELYIHVYIHIIYILYVNYVVAMRSCTYFPFV